MVKSQHHPALKLLNFITRAHSFHLREVDFTSLDHTECIIPLDSSKGVQQVPLFIRHYCLWSKQHCHHTDRLRNVMAMLSNVLCSSHTPSPLSSHGGTRDCLVSLTSPPEETGWYARSRKSLCTSLPLSSVLLGARAPHGLSPADTLSEPSGKTQRERRKREKKTPQHQNHEQQQIMNMFMLR